MPLGSANVPGYAQRAAPTEMVLGVNPSDAFGQDRTYWSLAKVKRAYLDYIGSKREEIQEQQDSRSYRHGAQWTTAQVEVFDRRKQPVVTYNRIGRKIDAIVGLMEKLKQDPKAYPRNPTTTSAMGAELATAVVRYVVEAELREGKFPFAIEQGAIDGIGGIEMMLIQGDKGDKDIGFALVQADSFFTMRGRTCMILMMLDIWARENGLISRTRKRCFLTRPIYLQECFRLALT